MDTKEMRDESAVVRAPQGGAIAPGKRRHFDRGNKSAPLRASGRARAPRSAGGRTTRSTSSEGASKRSLARRGRPLAPRSRSRLPEGCDPLII